MQKTIGLMIPMNIIYSNPRLEATFDDWPLGGNRRGPCRFFVENNGKKGVRVGRVTTGKPKYHTYHPAAAIVDGDNGRTYILEDVSEYQFVRVMRSDFFQEESVHQGSQPDRYNRLLEMIRSAK